MKQHLLRYVTFHYRYNVLLNVFRHLADFGLKRLNLYRHSRN